MRLEERADALDVLLMSSASPTGASAATSGMRLANSGWSARRSGEAAIGQVVAEPYAARGIEVRSLVGCGGAVMLNGAPMAGRRAGAPRIASRDAVGGPAHHGGHSPLGGAKVTLGEVLVEAHAGFDRASDGAGLGGAHDAAHLLV